MHPKIVHGLTLYFSLYSAPCRTVLLTMKALNIDLPPAEFREINVHDRGDHLTDSWFERINYQKVVPTLVDNGFVLWESPAIAKYLVQKFATREKKLLYPRDITQQALVDRLLFFDQGILHNNINEYFKPQAVCRDLPNPTLGAEMEYGLQLLEKTLEKGKYALGGVGGDDHLTIADFSFLASLSQLESMDYSYQRYASIYNYVQFLKDQLNFYSDCCEEGVTLMKDWSRKNFKYLPRYMAGPNIPYDEDIVGDPEKRI